MLHVGDEFNILKIYNGRTQRRTYEFHLQSLRDYCHNQINGSIFPIGWSVRAASQHCVNSASRSTAHSIT